MVRPDRERILEVVHAMMRNCHPGKPMLVDAPDLSADNVRTLATTIDGALHARASARQPSVPVV